MPVHHTCTLLRAASTMLAVTRTFATSSAMSGIRSLRVQGKTPRVSPGRHPSPSKDFEAVLPELVREARGVVTAQRIVELRVVAVLRRLLGVGVEGRLLGLDVAHL